MSDETRLDFWKMFVSIHKSSLHQEEKQLSSNISPNYFKTSIFSSWISLNTILRIKKYGTNSYIFWNLLHTYRMKFSERISVAFLKNILFFQMILNLNKSGTEVIIIIQIFFLISFTLTSKYYILMNSLFWYVIFILNSKFFSNSAYASYI